MNREVCFPGGSGVYPLNGDVQSQAGSPLVTVSAIQGIGVATPSLQGGEVLEYSFNSHTWVPTLRACITVDGVVASDDYIISIDVPFQVTVDGVGVS